MYKYELKYPLVIQCSPSPLHVTPTFFPPTKKRIHEDTSLSVQLTADKIHQLESTISLRTNRIEELEKLNADQSMSISALNASNRHFQLTLAEMETELNSVKAAAVRDRIEYDSVVSELNICQEECADLVTRLADTETRRFKGEMELSANETEKLRIKTIILENINSIKNLFEFSIPQIPTTQICVEESPSFNFSE